jgi:hypothetical protein
MGKTACQARQGAGVKSIHYFVTNQLLSKKGKYRGRSAE